MRVEPTLEHELRVVRSRWIVRDAVLIASRVVTVLAPLCLAVGWLDYRWDFSRTIRAAELAGLVAAGVWLARRFVAPVIRQSRDDAATALQAESAFGLFAGRLISRVEFERGTPPAGTSAALIEATCRRIDRQVRETDLTSAIDLRPVRRPGAVAVVLIGLLGAVVVTHPTLAGIWLERTLLPWRAIAWPRRTSITGLETFYRVRRGDTLTLVGRAGGEIPRTGELVWRRRDGRDGDHSATFDVAPDGAFRATLGPLIEDTVLSVEAGDARVADIRLNVVVPPELASIEATYRYPSYANRQPDTVQSGDVRALVGTQVALTLTADRAVSTAELLFRDATGERTDDVALTSDRRGEGAFAVQRRGRYQVVLRDQHGFATDTPATFVIDPIDNELPTVTIHRPGRTHRVTPATRLTLAFEATDDFGVTGAAIRWHKPTDGETPTTLPASEQPIPVLLPKKTWSARYRWDLAGMALEPGDEVEYRLELRDDGEHLTSKKVTLSPPQVLEVVDVETLRRGLATRLHEAFGDLDRLARQQSTSRDELGVLIITLAQSQAAVLPKDRQRLQIELNRQRRLQRQADRLADRLEAVGREQSDSFLADAATLEKLGALIDGLRSLAEGRMQQVTIDLEQARSIFSDADRDTPEPTP